MKKDNPHKGLPVMDVIVDKVEKTIHLKHKWRGKEYKRKIKYEDEDEWNSFRTDRDYDIHVCMNQGYERLVSIYPLVKCSELGIKADTMRWAKINQVVIKDRKITKKPATLAKACEKVFSAPHGGMQDVFDKCKGLKYHYCEPCGCETPTISYPQQRDSLLASWRIGRDDCAVCGQGKHL